ncbi:MAG: adenylate/guanylate cyclase domain-containing protein [Magnetococcales bacterium]|nr:adenylate/guanylate cyclase domain-containing protein [Magnetococcales bacterium]
MQNTVRHIHETKMLTLRDVGLALRVRLHLLAGLAALFLSFYGKVVCPFIDTLTWSRVLSGLALVWIFQVLFRETLYHWFPASRSNRNITRHGFILSIWSWLAAGVVASLLHGMLYEGFHWSSHLKLLSGYWGLGAGLLSQLEYVMLEHHFRRCKIDTSEGQAMERITARLMESSALIMLAPVMMVVLMSFRFVYEGYSDRGTALEVLFLSVIFVVTGLFVSWRYGQRLKQDCDQLLNVVQEVSEGRYLIQADSSRSDELGRVASGINAMVRGLALRERIREAFGRFVNPEVAEAFIHDFSDQGDPVRMGGQRRELTVLMADIRGFTPLSEEMEPEALTTLLNAYFSEMVAAVQAHGGMVDKFIGDAIMAVFGLQNADDNHAEHAVEAALEMRQRLGSFNEIRKKQGMPPLENGIGIHVGDVLAGYIGSSDRLEFTVIGHTVNLAARIESQTKPPHPPILFSDAVANRLSDRYRTHIVGEIDLKGISGETILYSLHRDHE